MERSPDPPDNNLNEVVEFLQVQLHECAKNIRELEHRLKEVEYAKSRKYSKKPLKRPMKCTICSMELEGRANYWAHLKSDWHKEKLQDILKGNTNAMNEIIFVKGRPHCRVCECDIPRGENHAISHLLGKKHLRTCIEQGRQVDRLLELRPELHYAWQAE